MPVQIAVGILRASHFGLGPVRAANNLCFDREQTSTFIATFTFGF